MIYEIVVYLSMALTMIGAVIIAVRIDVFFPELFRNHPAIGLAILTLIITAVLYTTNPLNI